ncbi:transposase [Micromonospora sp. NPDC049101]|uniref:transposase n=1 Tax=Micromonospora sp. NPDC049101 TaxID=3155032 RepID=UPI0033CDEAA8
MSGVRRFVVAGLDTVAARRRRRGLRIAALDETGQQKAGTATCGVKRQYMGCAGRLADGINTAHLAYVRERVGHAVDLLGEVRRLDRRTSPMQQQRCPPPSRRPAPP